MLAVQGTYQNGHFFLQEKVPFTKKVTVIVTFIEEPNFYSPREIIKDEPLSYKKLEPLAHSTVINYPVTDENLDDVKPFGDVNDAADYVQTLRQQTWNKNA